jgi:glycosyltransferase involved in cell wall biosynthesis
VVYRAVVAGRAPAPRTGTDGPALITTGRLVPNKGQELLIRMLPRVLERWPRCTLTIIGEGPARQSLERLAAELGVARQVKMLGLCDDVGERLAQADLFVYASWFEGFANAMAEAIAHGLPVVAVDLPVFREIAPPASGTLVAREPQAFAEAVLRVLAALPGYRTAALREAGPFRERFSVTRYIEETEAVYEQFAPAATALDTRTSSAPGAG